MSKKILVCATNYGTWGEELLKVHRSYLDVIRNLIATNRAKAFSHITGGGLPGNVNRIIPEGMTAVISRSKIPVLDVFRILKEYGGVPDDEMYRVFNMGTGLVAVVGVEEVKSVIAEYSGDAFIVGDVEKGRKGDAVVLTDS